ncbi:low affinity iron permease family protein [Solitalea sp. MAHUQ-68]|uniref:Low affinity iron permease family protein n=1 Tax=Solitalea agri TaxID=2953739 RepID=A0A9X2F987_9SPHI|nr:low affinity iron permease family protein [Solitalea agri]MCO4294661.1 low affinity iron permease family protein [Solitalea agri]
MKNKQSVFERMASKATQATGSTAAFLLAFGTILIWIITGPIFGYSDTWQLVINTGTTIITFLMVFLIQKTQNKDSLAIHIKLNELVAANELTSNRVIAAEDLSEDELRILEKYYGKLAEMAKKENGVHLSHSIDEAMQNHQSKMKKSEVIKDKKPLTEKDSIKSTSRPKQSLTSSTPNNKKLTK